jgi:ATP-binding cassette, subfamily B, bacterial
MKTVSVNRLYTNFRILFNNAKWAISQTWRTDPRLLSGIIVVNVIQSVLPLGIALAARGIVNAVVALLKTPSESYRSLIVWLGLAFAFSFAEAACRFSLKLYEERLHDEVNLKVNTDIQLHAESMDLSFFEDPRFQDMMERARKDTARNFSNFIVHTVTAMRNTVQILSLMGLLVIIEPVIAMLMIPISAPYLFYQWRLSKSRFLLEHSRTTKRRWTGYFVSHLTSHESIAEIKLLGLAPLLRKKFEDLMNEFRNQDRKLYLRNFTINMFFTVLLLFAAYFAFARVAFRVVAGELTVGDIAIFGGAATRLRFIIENAIMALTKALEQTLYISNLIELFNIQPLFSKQGNRVLPSVRGEVEIQNLDFTYPGAHHPALIGVSLNIREGETVALVGDNGAGKTTLVKLIARLYEPSNGCIRLDGHNLRDLSLSDLYRHISFVFQRFGRYEASFSDNIAYGDWRNALDDREKVHAVAEKIGILDMIAEAPNGLDTLLGRTFGEYTLSEGQWQYIALARAFARDAALLILDEPTSNMDINSEYRLFRRFKEIAKGRTTIIISHRFSTVSMADRIVVMEKGRIIEEGTHQQLLTQAGHYAGLYDLHARRMAMPG